MLINYKLIVFILQVFNLGYIILFRLNANFNVSMDGY